MFKNTVKKIPFAKPVWRKLAKTRNMLSRKTNVAVFHTARCGSVVVGNMLQTHDNVFWAAEIFRNMNNRYPDIVGSPSAVRTIIVDSMYSRRAKVYGFETKYLPQQHFSDMNINIEDYLSLLQRLKFSKFVVFRRKNYLRQIISMIIGKINKEWHTKEKTKAITKITIDVRSVRMGKRSEPLLDAFRCLDEHFERLKGLLSANDTYYLTYEDDILEDPRKGYEKLCHFLDIQSESPPIIFKRTNPFPLEDIVTNFDEIRFHLKDTKYNWMLDF